MAHPENAAEPVEVVAVGPPLQVRAAPAAPVPGVMARWMVSPATGTGLPPRSSTATVGCPENALPPVAPDGALVKPTWAAGPTAMSKGELVVVRLGAAGA